MGAAELFVLLAKRLVYLYCFPSKPDRGVLQPDKRFSLPIGSCLLGYSLLEQVGAQDERFHVLGAAQRVRLL